MSHGVHSGPCSAPGRTQEASPQALKAFRDFYPTVGLPDDMMVLLPKSGSARAPSRASPAARLPDPQSVQAGGGLRGDGQLL